MRARIRIAAWSCLVLALALRSASAGEPVDAVSFPTTEYTLVESADVGVLHVRLTPAPNATAKDLHADLLDAAEDGWSDPALLRAFSAAVSADDRGVTLDITVPFDHVRRATTYSLVVAISSTTADTKRVVQTLKLKHASARAEVVPATIVVERYGWLPGTGEWEPATLLLEETSGRSRITPQTVIDLHDSKRDDEVASASVQLTPPQVVMAGSAAPFTVRVEDAPAGKVTGKFEVRAPQVEDAISIQYELHSRVHRLAVIVALVLGLGLGFVIKYLGHQWLEIVKLRRQLAELASDATTVATTHDRVLREAALAVGEVCTAAYDSKQLAALTTTIQNQRTALTNAQTEWGKRLDGARTDVGSLAKTLETPWSVPEGLAPTLSDMRDASAHAKEALARGDAVGAAAAVSDAIDRVQAAKESFDTWRKTAGDLVTQLAQAPTLNADPWPEAPGTLATQIAPRIDELRKGVGEAPPADLAALATWLPAVNALEGFIKESAARLDATWRLVIGAARNELAAVTPNPLARLEDLLPRVDAQRTGYLAAIATQGAGIVKEFRSRVLAGVPDASRAEIITAIDDGKWARAAAKSAAARPGPQGPMLGPIQRPEPMEPLVAPATSPERISSAARPVLTVPDALALLTRAKRAEVVAAHVTTMLSFAVLVIVYGVHYVAKPVGTWPELAAIFAQALSIDIGVDAVVQGVKSLVT